jgi:hypothetical protein
MIINAKSPVVKLMHELNTHTIYDELSKLDYEEVDQVFVREKMNVEDVAVMRKETLRYLSLCAVSDKPLGPSTLVDQYWHQLILHTHLYAETARVCGKFIHHKPNDRSPEKQAEDAKAFWNTIQAYDDTFGEPDHKVWGIERR